MGKKLTVHIISIIFVTLLILLMSFSTVLDKFKPILVKSSEKTDTPIIVQAGNVDLIFSGWESGWEGFLSLDNTNKRMVGPKKSEKSFFYIEEDSKENKKNRIYWYNEEKNPQKIGYLIDNPFFKPYLKLQMFANTEKELEKAGYGFNLKGFDVYLPNGTILENDYSNVDGNLTGTNHKNELKYEIFYNEKDAIIIAGDFDYIDNLFRWEVFRPWISKHENNIFSPLYIIYIKDVRELKYEDNTWKVKSEQFTGNVEDYIGMVKKELDKN